MAKPQPKKPEPPKAADPAPVAEVAPKAPARLAFTLERVLEDRAKGITGGWSFVTIAYEVDAEGKYSVVSVTRTEPNIRPIAFESFKLATIKYLNGVG